MTDLEQSLPGYERLELPPDPELANTQDWDARQWQADFESSLEALTLFLRIRDPFAVLARTASRFILTNPRVERPEMPKQVEVEITQILMLLNPQRPSTNPVSPNNLGRYWRFVRRHLRGFMNKQSNTGNETDIERYVSRRARLFTLYYRNIFSREDCEHALNGILKQIDISSETALGYRLSDLFRAAIRLMDLVQERFEIFTERMHDLLNTKRRSELIECIDFFCSSYPLANRVWGNCTNRWGDLEDLRMAAFQVSEFAHPWIYTLSREDLDAAFPAPIVDVLYSLAIRPGSLSEFNPEHIYLNNPIWRRPYVLLDDGSLFAPLPHLIVSFPFVILESLMEGHRALEVAYESARANYLEEAIADLVTTAMPSASVYRGVAWDDSETGQVWENDVVAVVGNFIFVFEAKSGRIKDAARRGGSLSLRKNFNELFVQPGVQSGRLQNYLDTRQKSARLRLKTTGQQINLNLDKPKVVFTFSICIEHFASLTSARHYLKELGLVTEQTPWAPVLSLGDLQMIVRFLDSEVSLIHYLTRRATLEQVLDFEGDEQDILSAYLTNGLWVDRDALDGKRIVFFASDSLVRRSKKSRADRTVVEVHGISLPPLWEAIVRELYRDDMQRHRFDIINVILNQMPPQLAELERRIRRFRRGVSSSEDDISYVTFRIGSKVFALAIHLLKILPDRQEWHEMGRNMAADFMPDEGSVECALFLFVRRSRHSTFDGASFYRYIRQPRSDSTQYPQPRGHI
ncbi:hypothetical protein AB7008_08395 [Bradyrhizobium sp. 521_C7_N1_3]|uniref:hypothetical protein n=1 Tax=Bradyrhizobium sp. 521_C7_N1_3 TaxID=3240368 RepID=UPI003F8A7804